MNYTGVITDDELDALRVRNAIRRAERVRELGTRYVMHPSNAPEAHARSNVLRDYLRHVDAEIADAYVVPRFLLVK